MSTTSSTLNVSAGLKINPVTLWALAGAACVAMGVYLYAAWILSGNAVPTPTGRDPVPTFMIVAARIQEIGFTAIALYLVFRLVVRPIRQEGRMSLDGLMLLAFATVYWQDPVQSMWKVTFIFNTAYVQWGSWLNFIPGSTLPRGNLYSESIFLEGVGWMACVLPVMMLANLIMRKAQTRWPQLGTFGLIAICFGTLFTITLVVEVPWMYVGTYAYPSAIKGLTLFHGHYYQLPIYEVIYYSINWTALSCVRYFRNDRGETFAERGIAEVRGTPGRKTVLRFLAIVGIFNVIVFSTYSLPHALTARFFGDSWPADIVNRSYFTNQLCGPGTPLACP